ncbi:GNAT family N-acetyltransferase [Motilibacter aurantiacus]|uniref:GNAT family N-acetyltransferase n=1 Tax=Motilibacter aurantiacus TaxID=2714955 RepID=UPI00140BB116|nr:GNAT family N-acetyltransferase [Motilibacter aurantiacus]NHC44654.1 GNAT family N-acetyltransferase [Motilibacter aurantiacus]
MTLPGSAVLVLLAAEDAGELLTLQRAAFVTEAQAYSNPHINPLTEPLAAVVAAIEGPAVVVFGLRGPGGRLLAAARLRLDEADDTVAHLGRLVVAPDLQGRGLGGALLSAAESVAPDGVREIRLFTGARSAANLRLYRRHGYVDAPAGTEPAALDGVVFTHLVKALGPGLCDDAAAPSRVGPGAAPATPAQSQVGPTRGGKEP